ncbi:MAG: hypothetical protein GY754_16795 [bacterium]|nr:hypothetical protein [bacterium]
MKINFLTYGNHIYTRALKRIKQEAERFGIFENIHVYEPHKLNKQFLKRFSEILNASHGGGYWIWKPCIINEVLTIISDGDYLVYADAGCTINRNGIKRWQEYIEMTELSEYGCLSFQMNHSERNWTKMDVFDYFNIDIDSDTAISGQLIGGIILLKKCSHSLMLVNKWLSVLYENPLLFTDHCYNKQHEEFVAHRYDQSIFSVIRKLYGSVIIPDETYYSDWSDGKHIPFLAKRQAD